MMYRVLILTVAVIWLILVIAGIGMMVRTDGKRSLTAPEPETEEPVEAPWQQAEPADETETELPEQTEPTTRQETATVRTEPVPSPMEPVETTQIPEPTQQAKADQQSVPTPEPAAETAPLTDIAPAEAAAQTEPPEEPAAGLNPMDTGLDILRQCWLYTPSHPTENMPLIVYLHGGSGKGDDLNLITAVDGFPRYLQSGSFGDLRAYVLIPQLPAGQKGWAEVSDQLYELIQSVVDDYGIDRGNISLTGHSMGGTGTWSIGGDYPALFARIAPLSGSVRTPESVAVKLRNTPVWAFVGSEDTIVPPESSEQTIGWLMELSDQAKITVLDGADHFSVPSLAYLDGSINLIGWLLGG